MKYFDYYQKHMKGIVHVFFSAFFVFGVGFFVFHRYQLANYGVFTEGTIIELKPPKRAGPSAVYEFYVDGEKVVGDCTYMGVCYPKIGEKYPVEYSSEYPSINRIIINRENCPNCDPL